MCMIFQSPCSTLLIVIHTSHFYLVGPLYPSLSFSHNFIILLSLLFTPLSHKLYHSCSVPSLTFLSHSHLVISRLLFNCKVHARVQIKDGNISYKQSTTSPPQQYHPATTSLADRDNHPIVTPPTRER